VDAHRQPQFLLQPPEAQREVPRVLRAHAPVGEEADAPGVERQQQPAGLVVVIRQPAGQPRAADRLERAVERVRQRLDLARRSRA
jgi:hypothetical protein